jgi:hypothetical protein
VGGIVPLTPNLIDLTVVILSDERSEEWKDLRLFFGAMRGSSQ